MENSITINGKKYTNNEVNATGLVEMVLDELEIDHFEKSFEDFLQTEYFGTSMGDSSFAEFIECFPFINDADQNDEVMFIGEEWFLIPFDVYDDCCENRREARRIVEFWEKLLFECLETDVKITYEVY